MEAFNVRLGEEITCDRGTPITWNRTANGANEI
jgi:hypothetical protein